MLLLVGDCQRGLPGRIEVLEVSAHLFEGCRMLPSPSVPFQTLLWHAGMAGRSRRDWEGAPGASGGEVLRDRGVSQGLSRL